MSASETSTRVGTFRTLLDVLIILAVSIAAESAHFTWKQGRHVICADSVQYVDNAEALLSDELDPHFAMRAPGYSFLLAGVMLMFGNMGWAAVVANHVLQSLLSVAAYGLGRCIASRWMGWLAAMLTVCRLQTFIRGERIMSESLYTFFLSFGVLAFAWALSRRWSRGFLALSGTLLALAWLTRSIGIAIIAAAIVMTLYCLRSTPRRALTAAAVFAVPVLAACFFVCSLNYRYEGRFRPSTGCLNPGIASRCRFMQGVPFPDTPSAQRCLQLLPERTREEAYLANKRDVWVARYRAIHDMGMTEWDFEALMRQAAFELVMADPVAYVRNGAFLAGAHLIRRPLDPARSAVPDARRRPALLPSSAPDDRKSRDQWYAYFALPHRSPEYSLRLVGDMTAWSAMKAPFGVGEPWATLRYLSRWPATVETVAMVNHVASLWPGFAILLCGVFKLNRRVCVFIGLAYLFDAAVIGLAANSYAETARMHEVWLPVDTALVAALLGAAAARLVRHVRTRPNGYVERGSSVNG